ncbi:MAG TPA: M48 family metallopeptidase [Synergistales bacterium]|nr:M48 family metallopeptidase [Synergistales bacterium]HRV71358.1 M48 family metallopeptidase [Thermovirgaceae bacterium]
MKRIILRISLIALVVSLAASPVFAALSPESVTPIWANLTRTAGLTDAGPVNIENKKEPNAWVSFSANKYSVHATTGLLETLKDEHELAGVLAHEIGHIKLGHYNESINRSLLWLLLYKALGEKKVGGVDVLGAGIVLAEAGFSREQEIEADDYGVHLAAKAGYDPWGLYNAFNSMKKAGYKTSPSGFNSHPPTERRMIHVKATTEAVEKQYPRKNP